LSEGLHGDQNNPFQFLFEMNPNERYQLLKDEAPANLAIIGIFCSEEQMAEIIESQEGDLPKQIILELAKLKNLPEEAIHSNAKRLSEKIRDMKGRSEMRADGAGVAAQLLKSLNPETEYYLFE